MTQLVFRMACSVALNHIDQLCKESIAAAHHELIAPHHAPRIMACADLLEQLIRDALDEADRGGNSRAPDLPITPDPGRPAPVDPETTVVTNLGRKL